MLIEPKNNKIAIVVGIILLIGIVFLIASRANEDSWIKDSSGNWIKHGNPAIQDFDTCAKKYPIMETYPEQCRIPNGPSFTKTYN